MGYKKHAEAVLLEYNFQKGFGVNNFREIIKDRYKTLPVSTRKKISWKTFFKNVSAKCQEIQPSKGVKKVRNAIKDVVDNLIEPPINYDYELTKENEEKNIYEEINRGVSPEVLKDLGYAIP